MPRRLSVSTPRAPRFLFYSHDGMGLGHTRRNLAIATAVMDLCPEAAILVANSTDDAHRLGLHERVEVLKLPGWRKTGGGQYSARRLPIEQDEVRHLRAALLEAAVRSFRPAVVLVDKHPFGALGEFRAGLVALNQGGGRVVLGLRDILDDSETVRREWQSYDLQNRIAACHDRIFVYGERSVFDPVAEYALPPAVHERTRFCGYVVNADGTRTMEPAPLEFDRSGRSRPMVLATAGGGEDGFELLASFIDAAAGAPWQGVVVAGPMTPEADLAMLRVKARAAGVLFHTFIPRLSLLFGQVDALVCMGGYNTLGEAAAHGVPTVCVPRVRPRTEQLIRARAFERLGLLKVVVPSELEAGRLPAAIGAVLSWSRPGLRARVEASLNFDGGRRAARELLALAQTPGAARFVPDLTLR